MLLLPEPVVWGIYEDVGGGGDELKEGLHADRASAEAALQVLKKDPWYTDGDLYVRELRVTPLPRPVTLWIALHEERSADGVFSSEQAAQDWVKARPEADYTFRVEEVTLDG